MNQESEFKNLLVLYIGGTIGMQKNANGVYEPKSDLFLDKIKYHSEMHDAFRAETLDIKLANNEMLLPDVGLNKSIIYKIKEYDSLLDSTNMSIKDWIRIANDIEENYEKFDGFVILHGTDTLCYTSSVLSFMLEELEKPIIITGSQIPIFETRSDARDNLLASLIIAGCFDIPEVCVCFGNHLFRGNRATKISSCQLEAFKSPNYNVLADIGTEIKLHHNFVRKNPNISTFKVNTSLNTNVGLISIFPTITTKMMKSFLQPPIEGVVIQSYGAGNIPSNRSDLLEVIKEAVKRGVVVVNITQCPEGAVSVCYETGKALEQIGVIVGKDMTSEAALTKLVFVLGIPNLSYANKIKLMKTNLRGEMSE